MGRQALRITADTNILLRVIVDDDKRQAQAARTLLESAEQIIVPVTVFCEFAWVLRTFYRFTGAQIATAIEAYLSASAVLTDEGAVRAGLKLLSLGGDFADGAVAHQGRTMGAAAFASFDAKARQQLTGLGYPTLCP